MCESGDAAKEMLLGHPRHLIRYGLLAARAYCPCQKPISSFISALSRTGKEFGFPVRSVRNLVLEIGLRRDRLSDFGVPAKAEV